MVIKSQKGLINYLKEVMTKTIQVSDETYELIKDQLSTDEKIDVSNLEDFVGQKLFIRTVTYHMVGEVEKVVGNKFFQMKDASWVADSKRFSDCLKNGFSSEAEIEPTTQAWLNTDSIVDMFIWKHGLPTKAQ